MRRRTLPAGLGTGLTTGLAGCFSNDGSDSPDSSSDTPTDAGTPTPTDDGNEHVFVGGTDGTVYGLRRRVGSLRRYRRHRVAPFLRRHFVDRL